MLFSEREGYTVKVGQTEDLDEKTRKCIWSLIYSSVMISSNYAGYKELPENLQTTIWVNIMENSIDEYLPSSMDHIKEYILQANFFNIFDIIESIIEYFDDIEKVLYERDATRKKIRTLDPPKSRYILFKNEILKIFEDNNVMYTIIQDEIFRKSNLIDEDNINTAIELTDNRFEGAKSHLLKSLKLYKDSDYENSIKESISAVESICMDTSGKEQPLSSIIEKLGKSLSMNDDFRKGLQHLYSYTSSANGQRHAISGKPIKSEEPEARYMLFSCSAFVNYIISRYDQLSKE